MKSPEIEFSRWVNWSNRNSLDGIDSPGVYLLSHFRSAPRGKADPLAEQILYIGETCTQTLRIRLGQFHRTAFEEKDEHSGGSTYCEEIGGTGKKLYVAVFPVKELSDEIRPFFIRYVERKLIWDYVLSYEEPPECNRK